MRIKKLMILVLITALLLPALVACTSTTTTTGTTTAATTTAGATSQATTAAGGSIKIGGLAPMTGDVSVYGIAASNGAKLAFGEINKNGGINGQQIDFVVLDEKGDVTEAINAYNKLVDQEKVVAILGDVTSKPTISVAQLAAKTNMPLLTPTATALDVTKQGSNIFRACYIDPFQGKIMAVFAADTLKVKKVAVIYNSGDDYSVGLMEAFKAEAASKGLELVASEGYSKGDTDFKAQLTTIAESGAEALFVPDYYNTVSLIANQAKTVGLTIPLMGADGWDGILTVGEPTEIEGYYFCNHYSTQDSDPKVQNFLAAYKSAYGEEANALAALGYDAAYILAEAIKKAGSTDSAAIVKALAETDYTGVTGNVKFDADRNPTKSVTIIQIKNGAYSFFSKIAP